MQNWEYKWIRSEDCDEATFNLWGSSGWELVGFDTATYSAVFKRPLNY